MPWNPELDWPLNKLTPVVRINNSTLIYRSIKKRKNDRDQQKALLMGKLPSIVRRKIKYSWKSFLSPIDVERSYLKQLRGGCCVDHYTVRVDFESQVILFCRMPRLCCFNQMNQKITQPRRLTNRLNILSIPLFLKRSETNWESKTKTKTLSDFAIFYDMNHGHLWWSTCRCSNWADSSQGFSRVSSILSLPNSDFRYEACYGLEVTWPYLILFHPCRSKSNLWLIKWC